MSSNSRTPRRIVIDMGPEVDVREAIALPELLAQLPREAAVALDFRNVRSIHEAVVLALIPALASVHDRSVTLVGLNRVYVMPSAQSRLAA